MGLMITWFISFFLIATSLPGSSRFPVWGVGNAILETTRPWDEEAFLVINDVMITSLLEELYIGDLHLITSKPLFLRPPKLHTIIYSLFPTFRRNLIDTMM